MTYAATTSVPIERSRAEIEGLVVRAGADQFVSGWSGNTARVEFRLAGRFIRLDLHLPDPRDDLFTTDKRGYTRTPEPARKLWEQACRSRWRALVLVVKAKLEAVEAGISTLEEEFLAHVVVPGGGTVGDHMLPAIAEAYETGKMTAGLLALPAPKEAPHGR